VHAAQLLPSSSFGELAHGLATLELFEQTSTSRGMDLDGDTLTPTDAPGLGVEIDEAAL
jgi:L-alanine-DL-glutamate epimerase-like enolase superfamily enzyme